MGRLIKNHWARLIILTAASCASSPSLTDKRQQPADNDTTDQVAAAIEGFFWPKIFWDFLTKTMDGAVKPMPILQTINLVFGLWLLAWEWPLGFIAGTVIHRSIEARLAFLPMSALAAILLYQATNAAIYQMIGLAVYFWAYSEGEVRLPKSSVAQHETDFSYRAFARGHGPFRPGASTRLTHERTTPRAQAPLLFSLSLSRARARAHPVSSHSTATTRPFLSTHGFSVVH